MVHGRKIGIAAILIAALGLPLVQPTRSQESPARYTGHEKCAPCHSAIHNSWLETRHARSIDSLKKTNQEGLAACVKCHVTGYERNNGFLDYELTPEMAGVQCEACHGPGGRHVTNPGGEKLAKNPGEAVCRECHTQGQDPGFDYEKKAKLSHIMK